VSKPPASVSKPCSQHVASHHRYPETAIDVPPWPQPVAAFALLHLPCAADVSNERVSVRQYPAGDDEGSVRRIPALSIEIRNLQVTTEPAAGAAVATYEEWHIEEGQPADGRLCSATFIEDPVRPNAVGWMHVHESRLNVS